MLIRLVYAQRVIRFMFPGSADPIRLCPGLAGLPFLA